MRKRRLKRVLDKAGNGLAVAGAFLYLCQVCGGRAFRVAVLGSGCRQNDVNKRLIFNLRLTSRD